MPPSLRLRCALPALAAVALVWTWEALTVHYTYGGKWSGLFCIGDHPRIPAPVAAENDYVFRDSWGYDGQFYHLMAHDPWFQRGYAVQYIDAPRLRVRRILISALAWFAAFGRDAWIDRALIGVVLAFIGLGVYWTARLAQFFGRSAWWALGFVLLSPVLTSIDRTLTDATLAALTVGFVYYARRSAWAGLWLVCTLAALTRETGVGLAAAAVLSLAIRRELRLALAFTASLAPALGWYWFCALHTPPFNEPMEYIPFGGILHRLVVLSEYNGIRWVALTVAVLDHLALVGVLLALWAAWRRMRARDTGLIAMAMYAYVGVAALLPYPGAWTDGYAFGRSLGPLFILAAADVFESRTTGDAVRQILPAALEVPRTALQWSMQILAVLRGLTGFP
jgi:hypothetical protein